MIAVPLIRLEQPGDVLPVRRVLEAAFGGSLEADVTDRLRADGDFMFALVAQNRDGICGYAGFSRLMLDLGARSVPVCRLAPVGVLPGLQRTGIGSALVRAGIGRLRDRAERLLFVLGDPAYYGRFGFRVMDGFVSKYAGAYFQALALAPDAPVAGRVTYPKAFDEFG